jgi:hypothetical protein
MIKDIVKFTTAAAILSPVLAAEDVLRHFGVPISKHGLMKNDEGKGIFEIWKESEPEKPIDLNQIAHDLEAMWDKTAKNFTGFVIPEGS